jgi:hypothetical protein
MHVADIEAQPQRKNYPYVISSRDRMPVLQVSPACPRRTRIQKYDCPRVLIDSIVPVIKSKKNLAND